MKNTFIYPFSKKLFFTGFLIVFSFARIFAQAPLVSSFSPAIGPIGTSVSITGLGFNTTPTKNIVFFGATAAKVTAASTTNLTVTVPAGATYQPISVLNLDNALTGYSSQPFVTTFSPAKSTINKTTFSPRVTYSLTSEPHEVFVSDIDGDGKPDLIVTGDDGLQNNGDAVSVLRNTSVSGIIDSNSFVPAVQFAATNSDISAAVGDVDGDGKPDLIVVNTTDSTISVYRNTSTVGSISFAPPVIFPSIIEPYLAKIADIDGDGKPDLVVLSYNNAGGVYDAGFNTVSVFRNTSTAGTISFAPGVAVDHGHGNYSEEDMAIGDIDGDGKPDIVISLYINGAVGILRNTSTPGNINSTNSFAPGVFYYTNYNVPLPFSVTIGDLDGDGKPDLVVPNNNEGFLSIFHNTGTVGNISFDPHVDFPVNFGSQLSAIGDIDGDGKPDLVVTGGYNGDSIAVYHNISTPGSITTSSFAPYVTFLAGDEVDQLNNLVIADLDGDGRPDIVEANYCSCPVKTVSILHNAVSSIATLNNLTVSEGTLTPVFASGTFAYADTVSNPVTSITVNPTFTDSTSTITVNGKAVASGTPSGDIPLVVGNNTITVVVTAQNRTTMDTYTIIVYRSNALSNMVANNVITPNGDGKNDYWVIKGINLYPQNNVTVFDKAGRVVYSKRGYNNDWNGTINGSPLAQDTYYYVVDLGPNQPKFRGFISILRN